MIAERQPVPQPQAPAAEPGREGPPLVSKFAGDPIFSHLVQDFIADLPTQLNELQDAARAPDLLRIRKLSHRLTGAAATYGYPELAHAANELEILTSHDGNPDPSQMTRLFKALQVLGQRVSAGGSHV